MDWSHYAAALLILNLPLIGIHLGPVVEGALRASLSADFAFLFDRCLQHQ